MRAVITLTVPGTSSAGRARRSAVRCHVLHLAMEPMGQPLHQTVLGAR
jgi:hypothetical protein